MHQCNKMAVFDGHLKVLFGVVYLFWIKGSHKKNNAFYGPLARLPDKTPAGH